MLSCTLPKTRSNIFLWHNTSNHEATQHWTLYTNITNQRGVVYLAWECERISDHILLCMWSRKETNKRELCVFSFNSFYLFYLYHLKNTSKPCPSYNVLGISNNISTLSLMNFIWKNTYPWRYYQCIFGDVHMVLYDATFVLWFHRPHHHDHRCYCCFLCFLTRRKEAHYLWINGQQAITLMWWYSLSTCNMFICHLYSHKISAELNVNVI